MEHCLEGAACSCGFYPSGMSDRPMETMALHICRSNGQCISTGTECQTVGLCARRRVD